MSEQSFGDSIDPRPETVPPAPAGQPVPAPPPVGAPVPDVAATAPQPTVPQLEGGPTYAGPVPYPVTGAPYPASAAPNPYGVAAPPPRRSAGIVVLGIATGVLLLATAGLGVLWYLDHDEAARASSDQQAELQELRAQVAQLEEDLDDTETQLQQAEDEGQECPDAVQAFIDAAMDPGTGEPDQLSPEAALSLFEMINTCDVSP